MAQKIIISLTVTHLSDQSLGCRYYQGGAASHPVIEHWDGSAWTTVPSARLSGSAV
jgi:hypothetical protein